MGEILAEAERDHAAIGSADDRMRLGYAEMVQGGAKGGGLVEGGRRGAAVLVGDEVDTEDPVRAGIDRATVAD